MGGACTHAKSIVFASEYTIKNQCKSVKHSIKMLKDVGMIVRKGRETSIRAARQGMRACNNNNMPTSLLLWNYTC